MNDCTGGVTSKPLGEGAVVRTDVKNDIKAGEMAALIAENVGWFRSWRRHTPDK
jgi:hypothetical protein